MFPDNANRRILAATKRLTHWIAASIGKGKLTGIEYAGATAKPLNDLLALVDQSDEPYRADWGIELNFVQVGDSATVILMSGAPAIKGQVESIARGIGDTENPVGQNLLQNVNATFEWVRLAQRIPVRIKLVEVPNGTSALPS